MTTYFHKLDKSTKKYLLYKRKGMAVMIIFAGAIWAMEMAGLFDMMPFHKYFMPALLIAIGFFEILRAYYIGSSEFK